MPFATPKRAFSALCSILFILTGCQQSARQPILNGVDSPTKPAVHAPLVTRSALIEALNELQQIVASNDSLQVARLYSFPIPDSVLRLSMDSVFDVEMVKNGNAVTQFMFYAYYPQLKWQLGMDNLQTVLKHLDVNKLQEIDSLGFEGKNNKKPCYEAMEIKIEKDSLVHIHYSINTNSDYTGKPGKGGIECGEGTTFWTFVFDGRRLRLIRQQEAG
jgi:hypothetical protein